MAQQRLHLLIIDPQNDFCDLPADYCPPDPRGGLMEPSLPVTGAHTDMRRLAELINVAGFGLTDITATLDTHNRIDIAHPTFWKDAAGGEVAPFTPIAAADVRTGRYVPRDSALIKRVQKYLDALEAAGRYTHLVWPVHCELGTWGHLIHRDLCGALDGWEDNREISVAKVMKGLNPHTEHYSAVMAEVPDSADPGTQLNRNLLARLRTADRVYIGGEAGSHCVKATTEDVVANWPENDLGRLVLIEDAISPVAGFESAYADFLARMRSRGVRVATTKDVREELLANAL